MEPGEENEQVFAALIKEMAKANRPEKFTAPGSGAQPDSPNVMVAHLAEFEKLCALLQQHYHIEEPGQLTLYRFLMRLESLKEKFKPMEMPAE